MMSLSRRGTYRKATFILKKLNLIVTIMYGKKFNSQYS